jgi:DNA modification methylase
LTQEAADEFARQWDNTWALDIEDWFMIARARHIPLPLPMPCGNHINLGAGFRAIGDSVPFDRERGWDADREPLPYADGSVAGIWAHAFLGYVLDPLAVLVECQRVLGPGGVMNIVEPHGLSDLCAEGQPVLGPTGRSAGPGRLRGPLLLHHRRRLAQPLAVHPTGKTILRQVVEIGDAIARLRLLKSDSVYTCITSPPYWRQRDYNHPDQLGQERRWEDYVENLVLVFREVRRVLRSDGTLWINLGDKRIKRELIGLPWRVALALQSDGWKLRSEIIWEKTNPLGEPVKDRPTLSHEHLFLLSKSSYYRYDGEAIREPAVEPNRVRKMERFGGSTGHLVRHSPGGFAVGASSTRNRRTVWTTNLEPYPGAHFATFPRKLIEPCVLAGSPVRGWVLDPFVGSGTVGVVCKSNQRNFLGFDINPVYVQMARERIIRGQ